MNMEKFDPSDQKYKKVEDLPEEVRDRFANIVNKADKTDVRGFVRDTALEPKEALRAAEKAGILPPAEVDESRTYRILEKIRETFSPADVLGVYLYEFAANRIGEMEEHNHEEKIDSSILRRREGARAELENFIQAQIDQARFEVNKMSERRLQNKGHTGHLVFFENSYKDQAGREGHDNRIEGVLDGHHISILFHYRREPRVWENEMSGTIDGKPLSDSMARRLYGEYQYDAVDILAFDKIRKDLLLNGGVDDKQVAALLREKKGKIADLKESAKTSAELQEYEKALEEAWVKDEAEREKRERDAKDPRVAAAKLAESLLPKKTR